MTEADEAELGNPEVVADVIGLTGTVILPEVIATWTTGERERAVKWAAAEHLSASDNPVKRLEKPRFVTRAAGICGNPVTAQLAVEAWTAYRERGEFSSGWEDVYAFAQDAVTGLLALLAGRPEEKAPTWQRDAVMVLRANPAGIRTVDLIGFLGTACPQQEVLEAWLARGVDEGWARQPSLGSWALAEGR